MITNCTQTSMRLVEDGYNTCLSVETLGNNTVSFEISNEYDGIEVVLSVADAAALADKLRSLVATIEARGDV